MKKIAVCLLMCSVMGISVHAQLTIKNKKDIVDSLVVKLNSYYVFPQAAKQMEQQLYRQMANKYYDTISSEKVFSDFLTADLRRISNDKHLHVNYSVNILPIENSNPSEMPQSQKEAYAGWLLSENYGIAKLDVLPGNIGYIGFKWFCGPEYAGDTYVAAMNYLSHTDALIVDLRKSNGAMSMYAIPFICSYFFEESTHLNDFYWREKNQTIQTWTQTVVPGKKYLNKPIYILTSGKTFSGAEELAYDLKNLGRAVLVGETTGGGANGGGTVRLTDHLEVFIPSGRAINPVTKTNWEGVGVIPDTLIKSNRAFYKAHTMALQQLILKTGDSVKKAQIKSELTLLEQNTAVYKKITFSLAGFDKASEVFVAGNFNNWSVKSDRLQRRGNVWITDVEAEPGEIIYKFIVDGQWILDPSNKEIKTEGGNINSLKKIK